MEEGESVLEAIFDGGDNEDDNFEDVEMLDVEEGEFVVDDKSQPDLGQNAGRQGGSEDCPNQEFRRKNQRRRANKKRNRKRRGGGPGPNVTDINKFVLDTCRRLKEKKSYMVYTAVGCLGVSALSDLVKEVDAIQSCGGQMTDDGRRARTGGGILWNIMKTREPMAYKEIMKRAKEFEKQFRQKNVRRASDQNNKGSSQGTASAFIDETPQYQNERSSADEKHQSVHDRLRVPVSYDDLLGDEPKND